jgi:hypothetical protein
VLKHPAWRGCCCGERGLGFRVWIAIECAPNARVHSGPRGAAGVVGRVKYTEELAGGRGAGLGILREEGGGRREEVTRRGEAKIGLGPNCPAIERT